MRFYKITTTLAHPVEDNLNPFDFDSHKGDINSAIMQFNSKQSFGEISKMACSKDTCYMLLRVIEERPLSVISRAFNTMSSFLHEEFEWSRYSKSSKPLKFEIVEIDAEIEKLSISINHFEQTITLPKWLLGKDYKIEYK